MSENLSVKKSLLRAPNKQARVRLGTSRGGKELSEGTKIIHR